MLLACVVALIASGLTLFTGFGLGTLLLPALALHMGIVDAVAVTALVHLLNNLFKAVLVGRWARRDLVLWFGLPAMLAASLGASLLTTVGQGDPLAGPTVAGTSLAPTPADLLVGLVIVVLALRALRTPHTQDAASPDNEPRSVVMRTGALSGFIGGVSGHQGAVRSAYLLRLKLDRNTFVGTNVAIACLVDVARLLVYRQTGGALSMEAFAFWGPVALCAFLGAYIGARLVQKTTLPGLRKGVAVTMVLLGLAIAAGLFSQGQA